MVEWILQFFESIPTVVVLIFIVGVGQIGMFWGVLLSQWEMKKSLGSKIITCAVGVFAFAAAGFGGYRAVSDFNDGIARDALLAKLDKDLASASSAVNHIDEKAKTILEGLSAFRSGIENDLVATKESVSKLKDEAKTARDALEAVQKQTKAGFLAQSQATKSQEENLKKLQRYSECRATVIARNPNMGSFVENWVMAECGYLRP